MSKSRRIGRQSTVTRRAIAYVRVSTEEQAREGVSLAAQTERIQAYCIANGLELVAILCDEGVSASRKLHTRPQGAQLVELIASGDVSHVVAFKLDRLFRDAVNCLESTSEWDRQGVALHLLDIGGQAVDTSSAMGRFFLTVMAACGEMERNLIRERTSTAMQHMIRQGVRLGAPPLGFSKRNPAGSDDLVADEVEAVALILERRGAASPPTFRAIAAELTAAGHRTKTGKNWYAATVRNVWERRDEYAAILPSSLGQGRWCAR